MKGRDQVNWSAEVWKHLDAAVHEELTRARVAAKFLPILHVSAKTLTEPSDAVPSKPGSAPLSVDEAQTTPIGEYSVEFILTPAQVEHEAAAAASIAHGHSASTAITLARRAANILAQAEDMVIFQGSNAFKDPLFSGLNQKVTFRNGPVDAGLLQITLATATGTGGGAPRNTITVRPVPGQAGAYQSNTVAGVAQAYAGLQAQTHYGPYALVLHTVPFADTYTPLASTLITPAAPIKGLVTAGYFGSGTLLSSSSGAVTGARTVLLLPSPSDGSGGSVLYTGVLVSIDANLVDLVRGHLHPEHDAVITFVQRDVRGNYLFRVAQRFALRLKDPSAVTSLEFADDIPTQPQPH